jgi:ubiquinone/menaquinone biosynthesis C-methylase UbiE
VLGHLAGLEMSVGKRPSVTLALELLGPLDGAHVIEVGCGPGVVTKALASTVETGSVTGIDPSGAMLAQARVRNRAGLAAGRVRLVAGTAEALPAEPGEFTHYLSMHSIGFWSSVERGLAEAQRVLAPGGRLVILSRHGLATSLEAVATAGFDCIAEGERALGRRRIAMLTARRRP